MDSLVKETGLSWFKRLKAPCVEFKTGCAELDTILSGGFKMSRIYTIDGDGGTGKTQLCFTIIANHLLTQKKSTSFVYFVDFNRGFKPSRMEEILRARDPNLTNDVVKSLLKRILLVVVTNSSDFQYFFTNFSLISRTHPGSLIICDNVGLMLSETTQIGTHQGVNQRNDILIAMKHLAEKKHMPIILTNHMRKYHDQRVPALFHRWNQAFPIHILLAEYNNQRQLQIMDENMFPRSEAIKFMISNTGIVTLDDWD